MLCHIPGSTLSLLTIHRKKRFSLLHALPPSGEGKNVGIVRPHACSSFLTSPVRAGRMFGSCSLNPARKQNSKDPYSRVNSLRATSRLDRISPVVKRCLKNWNASLMSAGRFSSRKDDGLGPMMSRTDRTLRRICRTRPYASAEAMNALSSLSSFLS